jgi:hypothetical protein
MPLIVFISKRPRQRWAVVLHRNDLKLKSGIHDFSSCLPAGAQDGTGDGKDHSEFPVFT